MRSSEEQILSIVNKSIAFNRMLSDSQVYSVLGYSRKWLSVLASALI